MPGFYLRMLDFGRQASIRQPLKKHNGERHEFGKESRHSTPLRFQTRRHGWLDTTKHTAEPSPKLMPIWPLPTLEQVVSPARTLPLVHRILIPERPPFVHAHDVLSPAPKRPKSRVGRDGHASKKPRRSPVSHPRPRDREPQGQGRHGASSSIILRSRYGYPPMHLYFGGV